MKRYLVFDIGATKTRLALAGLNGISEPRIFYTDKRANGYEKLILEVRKLVAGQKIDCGAGGIASPIDYSTGRIINSPNLPLWGNINLSNLLSSEIKAPVKLENDVAMVGLGEAIFGAGRGSRIVAYLTFSTGINGSRIIEGQLDRSSQGFQIGFQIIQMKAGGGSSLEDLAGGNSLARKYGRSPHEVAAMSAWREVERAIITGIYNTMLYWSPDTIVIGGGMMNDLSIEKLQRGLAELPPVFAQIPQLIQAELGDLGGLQGSLAWVKQG